MDVPVEVKQTVGGSALSAGIRTFRTHDFDELADAMSFGQAHFRQLSGGPFRGTLETAQAGECRLSRVAVNRVIQARGAIFPGHYSISLVTPGAVAARWRGRHLKVGQVNVLGPKEAVDHLSSDDYESLTVAVLPDALRQAAHWLYGIDLDDLLPRNGLITARPGAFAALKAYCRSAFKPLQLYADSFAGLKLRRAADAGCLRRVVEALAGPAVGGRLLTTGSHQRIARLADDVMQAGLKGPLGILDVCREVGVSERTLRYVFRERFGMGPKAYLKALRLNAVRRALKEAGRSATTVHAVARAWGFWHTGAFSADYRRLFGELPSETLEQ